MTILCIASYEKGEAFIRQCKSQGCAVVLLTSLSLKDKARWPMDCIDEIFYMPDQDHHWDRQQTLNAVSYLARTRVFDRIVPLDDFDVEVAAMLREHLRVPGMGETTARYFRDKLAMRMRASEAGIPCPEFIHVLNYDKLRAFLGRVPAPWVLKPRSMAGAIGIKKLHTADDFWRAVDELGDMQSYYLLEQFVPGDVFHVDAIVYERKVLFSIASVYGRPPMAVSHEGGIFTTRVLERDSDVAASLKTLNASVLETFGMLRGVSHSEFIRANDGQLYFLETSARVGGAHVADMVEAATGINLWAEWAKIEILGGKGHYDPPIPRQDYAGLLVSLARQQHPDTSAYNDPELVWRMNREHHVGLIVTSPDPARVSALLTQYVDRVQQDFHAALPPKQKPSS